MVSGGAYVELEQVFEQDKGQERAYVELERVFGQDKGSPVGWFPGCLC